MAAELLRPLPVTALFGGVVSLAWIGGSLVVGLTRVGCKKFYGADNGTTLEFRSRGAATIAEYGVPGTVLLALLEYHSLLSPGQLWWWGAVFATARVAHGLQLAAPRSLPMAVRPASFLTTVALITFASVKLLSFGLKASN